MDKNIGIKYKKKFFSRYFSIRVIRLSMAKVFFTLFPCLKKRYNFYTNIIKNEDVASKVVFSKSGYYSYEELGVSLTQEHLDYIKMRLENPPAKIHIDAELTLHNDVYFLGNSGTVIDIKSSSIIRSSIREGNARSYIKFGRLKEIKGDDNKIYIPMLGLNRGHKHYFHFFGEYLVELYHLLKFGYNDNRNMVIVTRDDLSPVQEETYKAILQKYPDIEHLRITKKQKLYCKNALLSFYYSQNKVGLFIGKDYVDFLNDALSKYYNFPDKKEKDRIYLSRTDAKLRQLTNEKELIDLLKSKGFKIVTTGNKTLKEQMEIFRNAEIVVTVHGAGMTNIIFCGAGTKIIEIASKDFGNSAFIWISGVMNMEHKILIGEEELAHQHFSFDVTKLKNLFEEYKI